MFQGIIRELKIEDVKDVQEIFGLYWAGELKDRFVKRLNDFVNNTPESVEQKYNYFVAEENGEVVGVAVLRVVPEHLKQYTHTTNPAEFYIIASKYKGKGIGKALREKRIEEAKKLGFTEIVLFSAEDHKDSWSFHDNSDFKRIASATAPNGEPGFVWRMDLK